MEIDVERLGINGEGVGSWYGCVVFVDHALPGERVFCQVYEKKKNYAKAFSLNLLRSSSERVNPICPLFGKCGGCQIMHLSYDAQLKYKSQKVKDALQRIGKLVDVAVLPCISSPNPLMYRNKIQIPIQKSAEGLKIGLYARLTHDVIDMKNCYIHCELGQKVYERILSILSSFPFKPFDPLTGEGDIRHILIKTAVKEKQVLVVIVTCQEDSPHLTEIAKRIKEEAKEVVGVIQNINSSEKNSVLGEKYHLILGKEKIEENLCGLYFHISAASFFQVNTLQAEQLYETVLNYLCLNGEQTVLDAYCGVGTLSLLMALKAKKVIGIECVEEAVRDAYENAQKNNIKNIEFFCAETENFIHQLKEIDAVVLNPPRKGCAKEVLEALTLLKPQKIVYVSCDPATLSRDLAILCHHKWEIITVQPFDMFPQTAHVETVALLYYKG